MKREDSPAGESADLRPAGERNERLHAWLDGEMTGAEAALFERQLESDPELRGDVDLLRGMDDWLGKSRESAPPDLTAAISSSIRRRPARAIRIAKEERWAVIPAALAFAAVLLLVARISLAPIPTGSAGTSGAGTSGAGRPGNGSAAAEGATPSSRIVRRDFRFEITQARQVCLVGSFNSWAVCRTPLQKQGDGTWEVSLDLPPGRYEYMFVVDGRWECDPAATQYVDDGFGNRNAVLLL